MVRVRPWLPKPEGKYDSTAAMGRIASMGLGRRIRSPFCGFILSTTCRDQRQTRECDRATGRAASPRAARRPRCDTRLRRRALERSADSTPRPTRKAAESELGGGPQGGDPRSVCAGGFARLRSRLAGSRRADFGRLPLRSFGRCIIFGLHAPGLGCVSARGKREPRPPPATRGERCGGCRAAHPLGPADKDSLRSLVDALSRLDAAADLEGGPHTRAGRL